MAVSIEQPSEQIDTSNALYGAGANAVNKMPDLTAHIRYEDKEWGHLQLGGIYRLLTYENNVDTVETSGWGVSFTGALNVLEHDSFTFQTTYGQGIGRYVQDSSGLSLDAGLDANGTFTAIPIFAAAAGYTHQWAKQWKSTASYGYVNVQPDFTNGPLAFSESQYASLNLIYQPSASFRMGIEYLHGFKEVYNGEDADGDRINFVIKYDLVK